MAKITKVRPNASSGEHTNMHGVGGVLEVEEPRMQAVPGS